MASSRFQGRSDGVGGRPAAATAAPPPPRLTSKTARRTVYVHATDATNDRHKAYYIISSFLSPSLPALGIKRPVCSLSALSPLPFSASLSLFHSVYLQNRGLSKTRIRMNCKKVTHCNNNILDRSFMKSVSSGTAAWSASASAPSLHSYVVASSPCAGSPEEKRWPVRNIECSARTGRISCSAHPPSPLRHRLCGQPAPHHALCQRVPWEHEGSRQHPRATLHPWCRHHPGTQLHPAVFAHTVKWGARGKEGSLVGWGRQQVQAPECPRVLKSLT